MLLKKGRSIQHLSLHRPLPFLLRWDIFPFFLGEILSLFLFFSHKTAKTEDSSSSSFLLSLLSSSSSLSLDDEDLFHLSIFFLIIFSQIMLFLMCYWIVKLKVFFCFRNVSLENVSSSSFVFVVPAPNRGFSQIVPVRHHGLIIILFFLFFFVFFFLIFFRFFFRFFRFSLFFFDKKKKEERKRKKKTKDKKKKHSQTNKQKNKKTKIKPIKK